jgi:hypothetical protein
MLRKGLRANYWIAGIRLCLAAILTGQYFAQGTTLRDALSYAAFGLPLHFAGITWVIVTLSAWLAAASCQRRGVRPVVIWSAFLRPSSFLIRPKRLLQDLLRAEGQGADVVKHAGICWLAIGVTLFYSLGMLIIVGWDNMHPLGVLIPDLALSVIWCVTVGMTRRLATRGEQPQITAPAAA